MQSIDVSHRVSQSSRIFLTRLYYWTDAAGDEAARFHKGVHMIISAQSSGSQSTNSSAWTAMPGLSLTIPGGAGETVLLILNVPNPYASGNNYPGGNFGIQVDGALQPPIASFTYNEQQPPSTGRIPTTLCVPFAVNSKTPLKITAVWSNVRGSTVHIDSPATLTAIN
jgi:mannose-binding lectin